MTNTLKRQIRLAHRTDARIFNEAQPSTADIVKLVGDLHTSFAAFKSENDKRIADLAKGKDDVVTREHVDRINADVTKQAGAVDELQRKIAAFAVSGAGSDNPASSPERRQHRAAFNSWVKKGTNENGLRELEVKAALSTDSDPDGGFVVPEETDAAISRSLETVSAIRRLADVVTISGGHYKALHNLGGASSGWVGEQGSRAQTDTPRLSELNFPLGEIYATPAATQTMLDDARINVDAWLADEVRIAMAAAENPAFISGNGVNKPKGFIDSANGVVANASWAWGKVGFVTSGASGAFVTSSTTANAYDKLLDLYHALRSGYRNGAAFLMGDATLAEVRKVKDAEGNYIYLPPNATEPASILGKPVEVDDNMPVMAANSFSIAFAAWKQGYKIIDRQGVRVLRDPYSSKPYVLFYTTKRVGGGIRDYEAIKLMKFSA